MTMQSIPVVDLNDFFSDGPARQRFIEGVGRSLTEIGFFSITNHGIPAAQTEAAYEAAKEFFHLPAEEKIKYRLDKARGQRGFTTYGTEHAKDSEAPDLKEFYQVGRTDVSDDHEVHALYGPNVWPDDAVPGFRTALANLYRQLDSLGAVLLESCALYLGEDPGLFRKMAVESDTIVRVIWYPPVPEDAHPASVRAAAHEDINLITLLSGATSDGLELLTREGKWMPIAAKHDEIVVDSGDMLQNVTNGLFRAQTHRVVNPAQSHEERFSMPCFVHPRKEVDLTPLPGCVARTGGIAKFASVTAGEYLDQRLREIGLG